MNITKMKVNNKNEKIKNYENDIKIKIVTKDIIQKNTKST